MEVADARVLAPVLVVILHARKSLAAILAGELIDALVCQSVNADAATGVIALAALRARVRGLLHLGGEGVFQVDLLAGNRVDHVAHRGHGPRGDYGRGGSSDHRRGPHAKQFGIQCHLVASELGWQNLQYRSGRLLVLCLRPWFQQCTGFGSLTMSSSKSGDIVKILQ